ncbi:MAG: hypothetical protein DMF96_21530 [Acidobacteria bacterium]|nr:MAG: hypothetical protein DMF96_21530 [Acidobacteriota bacterium]
MRPGWHHPVVWEIRRTRIGAGARRASRPRFVDRLFVSGSYFATLGVNALLGRVLTPADDELAGGPDGTAAVLSYTAWKRRFNGDAGAVGMHVLLDRAPVTIVGVLPPFFLGTEVGRTFDFFLPGRRASAVLSTTPFDQYSTWLNIIVRLKPGQTVESSAAALRGLQPELRSTTRGVTNRRLST